MGKRFAITFAVAVLLGHINVNAEIRLFSDITGNKDIVSLMAAHTQTATQTTQGAHP